MTRYRALVLFAVLSLLFAACGGGSGDEAGSDGGDDGSGEVQAGTSADDDDDDNGELTIDDIEGDLAVGGSEDEPEDDPAEGEAADDGGDELTLEELQDAEAEAEEDEDRIDVAEAEEDPLDGLLNAFTVFRTCLEEDGFEFDGAPGQDGAAVEDFEPAYLQALGACATESDIQSAFQAFGEAEASLTPEDIAQRNFGLPVFKECMEDLGWEVADFVPDERGALQFGDEGTGLTPPDGEDFLDSGAINQCRAESEQYVAENYEPEEEG